MILDGVPAQAERRLRLCSKSSSLTRGQRRGSFNKFTKSEYKGLGKRKATFSSKFKKRKGDLDLFWRKTLRYSQTPCGLVYFTLMLPLPPDFSSWSTLDYMGRRARWDDLRGLSSLVDSRLNSSISYSLHIYA